MSLKRFIRRVCVQPVVYWEYISSDGVGGAVYAQPTEILVRWDEAGNLTTTGVVADMNGQQFVPFAQILTPDDLVEGSMVWLGSLEELLEQNYTEEGSLEDFPFWKNPHELDDVLMIKRMNRHPLFRSTTFDVFIAYLGK